MSLRSSAPALLHALRARCPGDTAPYLNQARATYPGGGVRAGRGAPPSTPTGRGPAGGRNHGVRGRRGRGAPPPPTDQPGIRRRQADPPLRRHVRGDPQGAHLVPRPPAGDARAPRLGPPRAVLPPLQDQGCPPQGAGPLARTPGHPPAPPRRRDPQGPGAGPGDHPHPPLRGSSVPRPPLPAPAARDGVHTFLRTQGVTPVTGVHLVRLPPAPPDDHRGPRALSPAPDWELWRDGWAARLPRLPFQCRWMATGPRPYGADATPGPPPPPCLPPAEDCTALPTARHGCTGR